MTSVSGVVIDFADESHDDLVQPIAAYLLRFKHYCQPICHAISSVECFTLDVLVITDEAVLRGIG